ncbi:hypothetical protein AB0D04_40445 [Streptomyces sp. NPDC048483]|uniref:hypothetical protein n=1 Tax=Streptomyces sp. NPDC048483 TaxID=3154927 RepID=UPI0034267FEE
MDEGKAALYAAIIGFAAAIIGAAAGGWASWKAARHGADAAVRAAIEQVSRQADSERKHWVRQERRAAYASVIDAYMRFVRTSASLTSGLELSDRAEPQEPYERLAELGMACKKLALFGPASVEEAGFELQRCADAKARRPSEAGVGRRAGAALGGFLAACKEALAVDDDH